MELPELKRRWNAFADKLVAVAYEIVGQSDNSSIAEGVRDPKVVALTLLCRGLCHFKSLFRLLDAGLIVDARTLTRCIFEDLFWQGRLAELGSAFVQEAIVDTARSRQARGNWVLDWIEEKGETQPYAEGLRGTMDKLRTLHPKPHSINFAQITQDGALKGAYLWYRQLSADAAHPSLESLSRHITKDSDGVYLISEPTPSEKETVATIEYACQALMGLIVGANQIAGPTKAGEKLSCLFEEFLQLASAV